MLRSRTAEARGAVAKRGSDLGHFVVKNVLTDPVLDNMQQRYFEDDPRLVGRLMTVEANHLGIDGDPACDRVKRRWTLRRVADLLRSHSQRRGYSVNRSPRPSNYGLKPVSNARAAMVEYKCIAPGTGKPAVFPAISDRVRPALRSRTVGVRFFGTAR